MRIVIWIFYMILIEANVDGVDAKDALEDLTRSETLPWYYARKKALEPVCENIH